MASMYRAAGAEYASLTGPRSIAARYLRRRRDAGGLRVSDGDVPVAPAMLGGMPSARVVAVHRSGTHSFSKETVDRVLLVEGIGVDGDTHAGTTVQHRSRVARDPSTPNLRQVHLIHRELFDQVAQAGYEVGPGDLGENLTTEGLDLLALPVGTRLRIGEAVVTVTGLRNPCQQINTFRSGLLKQVLLNDEDGQVRRLAGVMGIVSRTGSVSPGDAIEALLPSGPHLRLTTV